MSAFELDPIKEFLNEVRQGATEDPGSYATTAITHFKKLLDTALSLADQVQRQTEALQKILDNEFATVSSPPLAAPQPPTPNFPIPPGYALTPIQPMGQPYYPPPQYQPPLAQPQWPQPPPQQHAPQNLDGGWEPVQPAQTYLEEYQDPAAHQQGYQFPRRNGQSIPLGTPFQQQQQQAASATIPPTFNTFSGGGQPDSRHIRRETV